MRCSCGRGKGGYEIVMFFRLRVQFKAVGTAAAGSGRPGSKSLCFLGNGFSLTAYAAAAEGECLGMEQKKIGYA